MSSTYDNKARSQEAHRRTQDSLDAVAENTLGLINQAAVRPVKTSNSVRIGAEAFGQSRRRPGPDTGT